MDVMPQGSLAASDRKPPSSLWHRLTAWATTNWLLSSLLVYVAVYLCCGLAFYTTVEGWTFTEVIYFTTIVVSTTGQI
jgi:hypothetical protein